MSTCVAFQPEFEGEARWTNTQVVGLLDELMEALPDAAILVGADMRVLAVNTRATGLLAQADGLCTASGLLRAGFVAESEALRRAVAGPAGAAEEAHGFVARRPSGKPALQIRVRRIRAGQSGWRLILVHDPEQDPDISEAMLCRLHGLTRAESAVAARISRCMSVEEVAASLSISVMTARSHLKHAFAKLGVSRQAELVSHVLRGHACVYHQ